MALTSEQKVFLRMVRKAMDAHIASIRDEPEKVNELAQTLREWTPGIYQAGDVRARNGTPYKCTQTHDSTITKNWTPENAPALWMQYHGTTKQTARPWIAPTGAHDQYKAGEYMIWTDGKTYRALQDTAYGPEAYAEAWKEE